MPTPEIFTAKNVYDSIRDVSGGMNAGVDPLIINRSTLAYARNMTMRGTFPTHRPAYVDQQLTYVDKLIQGAFEQGLFQGAEYYKPDFGPESIIVSVSGRLFQIQIVGTVATISEVTTVGDPQNAVAPQIWMWQAEKWMVCNDSVGLPIFFDGNTSRRSNGTGASAGTITSATASAIGSTFTATMSATFSGPFNVLLNVISSGSSIGSIIAVATGAFSGYPVTLQNLTETVGTVEASGSQVTVQNNVVGIVASRVQHGSPTQVWTIPLTAAPNGSVGTVVQVPLSFGNTTSATGTITAISGTQITVTMQLIGNSYPFGTLSSGAQITNANGGTTLVALLNQSYTAPDVNSSSTAYFDRPYTGSLNQTVYINGKQFSIVAIGTPAPSTTVVFKNISVTAATNLASTTLTAQNELPAGKMGTYGLGRIWMALTDGKSFLAGDIVNGSSGTQAYNYRDAVLKVNENTILAGGGSFTVPGQVGDIRALIFSSVLDTSLGQGPLAVVTPDVVFSCQAPIDRTTWQAVTSPILTESMKGGAGLGQWSTIVFNSDILMRSRRGIRSYIQARRDFDVWGNVPQSREVDPILANDPINLLQFASAVEFDNRALLTSTPVQSAFGVYWTQLIALNADPVSSLRGKAPSVYDGVWDGLNVLKLVKGSFAGTERCFAICVSQDLSKIELTEILTSADSTVADNAVTPITWEWQSAALNFYENDPRRRDSLRLLDGELRIDKLNKTIFDVLLGQVSEVDFTVYYRADQAPDWNLWNQFTVQFDPNTGDTGYRYAIGLGEPSGREFDEFNNMPLREGSTFQFKVVVSGHCRINLFRMKATTTPAIDFARPVG